MHFLESCQNSKYLTANVQLSNQLIVSMFKTIHFISNGAQKGFILILRLTIKYCVDSVKNTHKTCDN